MLLMQRISRQGCAGRRIIHPCRNGASTPADPFPACTSAVPFPGLHPGLVCVFPGLHPGLVCVDPLGQTGSLQRSSACSSRCVAEWGRCQQGSWAGPIGGERLLLGASYATPALVRHAQRLRQRRGRRRWKRSWEQRSTRHVTSRKCDGRLSAPVARCCGGACRFLAGARSCRCARRGLSRRGDAPRFFDRCPREASRSLHGWLVAGGTGVGGSGTSVGATHFVDAPRSACRAAPSSKLKPQAPTTGLAVRNCRPPDGDWCPRTSTTAYLVADM